MAAKLQVELDVINKATKELNTISRDFNNFQNKIVAVGRAMSNIFVGGIATNAIKGQFEWLINEAKEYSKVQNQLRAELGYTSIILNKQVDALEAKYKIEDGEISVLQQQLALYTKDEQQIAKLTEATINYAKAKGVDLATASNAVTTAIVSQRGSLRGLISSLGGVASSTERITALTDILNKTFGGQAEAVAKSANVFDILKISIQNVKEEIAHGVFGSIDDRQLLQYKKNIEALEKSVTEGPLSKGFRNLSPFKLVEKLLGGDDSDYRMRIAAVEWYEKKVADAKIEARKKENERIAEETAEGLNVTPFKKSEKEIAAGLKKEQERKAALKRQHAEDKKFHDQIMDAEYADMEARYRIEQDAADEADRIKRDRMRETTQMFLSETRARVEAEQNAADERIMIEDRLKMAREQTARGSVDNLQVMAQQWKIFGGLYKRSAQAEATIDTYTGAQAAFKAMAGIPVVGPGLGIAAAAAAIGAGFARVAMIEAQQFSIGTHNAPGGYAIVGEHGPEMTYLPRGSRVSTATDTKALARQAGGHTFNITFQAASGDMIDSFTSHLRRGTANVDRMIGVLLQRAGI